MEVKYYALEKYSNAFTKWEIIRPYRIDDFDRCNREFTLLSDYGEGYYRITINTWVDDLGWLDEQITITNGFEIITKNQKQ